MVFNLLYCFVGDIELTAEFHMTIIPFINRHGFLYNIRLAPECMTPCTQGTKEPDIIRWEESGMIRDVDVSSGNEFEIIENYNVQLTSGRLRHYYCFRHNAC